MMNYLNALIQGLGVALGIIAGAFATFLVGLYKQRRKETQQTRNLRFELELNVKKLKVWLGEIEKYRNAVNGDSMHNYFGFFDISKAVLVTANAMFQSGLLYKRLDHCQIEKLQTFGTEFSAFGEQVLSNQVNETRESLVQCREERNMDRWTATLKPAAVANVDFWERKFKEHEQALEQIIESLP